MIDQMKAMGAIAGLLKNKERLREVGEQAKERIDAARLTGEAGGGAVTVLVTGRMQVIRVYIDPAAAAALQTSDKQAVEQLIADAMNDALRRVQDVLKREAARASDELGLPDSADLRGMLENLA